MAKQRFTKQCTMFVGVLALTSGFFLLPLQQTSNPYADVIAEVSANQGWQNVDVQMIEGRNTNLGVFRWTQVQMRILPVGDATPILLSASKPPFRSSRINCLSFDPQSARCDLG